LLLVKIQGFRNAVQPTTYPIYVKLRLLICQQLVSILAQDGVFKKGSINWDTMVKHTGTTNKRAAKRLFHRFLDKLPELDDDPDEETFDIEVEPPKLLAKISVDTKPGPKKRKHNPKDDDEGRFTT
jgi:hypothetical protein